MSDMRSCFRCKQKFQADESFFFRHSKRSDGLHSWCKACCKEGNNRSRIKKYNTFDGRIPTFLRTCKNSAEKRGHECTITASDLTDMWREQDGVCCYSGLRMELQPNTPFSVSVERVNNEIGYTADNTVLVCKAVNSMKSALTGEQFLMFCRAIAGWMRDDDGQDVRFLKYG